MPTTEYDAVVVGAGPNGLVAAALLVDVGWKVLVLEAGSCAGGGTRTEELTAPGFRHDVCSSVHPLALASPAFGHLALEDEGLEWAHPDTPLAHPLDDASAVLLRRDLDRTIEGLGSGGESWRRLVGPAVAAGQPLVDAVLSPLAPRASMALARFGAVGGLPATSVASLLLRGPRSRALFAGLAAHSVLDLHAPATTGYGLMLGTLGHLVGWPVAVGGSQSIADALVRRIRRGGGEILTDTRVTDLGELPASRAVLLDLTPRQVLEVAGERLPARYARALRRFRYGSGVFKVDWALDGPVAWRDPAVGSAATVHLGGELDEIARNERIVARGGHPDRPFVIFVQATVADRTRAPAGKHTAWAYCHVPNGSTVDMAAAIEAQVERFAPGFSDLVVGRHTMGPRDLESHNPNEVGGDITGGDGDLRQLIARPTLSRRPWATPVPGLYLCSASTPPGGGVHGMGGWHAARLAIKDSHRPGSRQSG